MKKIDLFEVGTDTVGGSDGGDFACGMSVAACLISPWFIAAVLFACSQNANGRG